MAKFLPQKLGFSTKMQRQLKFLLQPKFRAKTLADLNGVFYALLLVADKLMICNEFNQQRIRIS
jgi:hypothetical protein